MGLLDLGDRYGLVQSYKELGSYAAVARKHNVCPRTVSRYVALHKTLGELPIKQRRKRKTSISKEAAEVAADLLLSAKYSSGQQVASELHKRGLTGRMLSRSTVLRHARRVSKENGREIEAERGRPKKGLTTANMASRVDFSQTNKGRMWGNVMVSDRKKFLFLHPGVEVRPVRWKIKGEQTSAYTVNRPQAVNVYCGLTKFGLTKCHLVAGTSKMATKHQNQKGQAAKNITASEYEEVVSKTLLPEGNRIFSSQGITDWVLQQDNDPTHKAAHLAIAKFNGQHSTKVSLLPKWPANSPDLSPIENLWAIVDRRVQAAGCKTFDEFQKTVIAELAKVDKKLCSRLMSSMEGRLDKCIKLKGGRIKK